MNKIHGEHTRPTDAPALCLTCEKVTIIRGTRMGDDVMRCAPMGGRVTFTVTECNAYSDARLISIYALEEVAWRWIAGADRFVSPAELMRLRQTSAPQSPQSAQGYDVDNKQGGT